MANVNCETENVRSTEAMAAGDRPAICRLPFVNLHRGRTQRRRRGNAVLDMALVLPILLAVAFGTIEYGYFFFVKHTLQAAAREGARRAILSGSNSTDVTNAVSQVMTAAGFDSTDYTLAPVTPGNWATANSGTDVTVTVRATWGTIGVQPLPDAMGGIAADRTLQGRTVMRKE